jgi:hypothetical protein
VDANGPQDGHIGPEIQELTEAILRWVIRKIQWKGESAPGWEEQIETQNKKETAATKPPDSFQCGLSSHCINWPRSL